MGRNQQRRLGSTRAETSTHGGWTRQLVFFCWVAASATLMVVGAFGPWLKVFGNPVRGTTLSIDGWIIVAFAVLAGAAFLWMRQSQLAAIPAISGGALGAYTAIQHRRLMNDVEDVEFFQIGWGLNLAILASISLAISGLVWLMTFKDRATEPLQAVEPVQPASPPDQV